MTHSSASVSVALPGPWWTELTYSLPDGLCAEVGARVRVPVGAGSRIAVVMSVDRSQPPSYDGVIRDIIEVIDPIPITAPETVPLIRWFAEAHLCGVGTAAKTLLPSHFMKGERLSSGRKGVLITPLPQLPLSEPAVESDAVSFIYEPDDAVRYGEYLRILSDGRPTLILFPVHSAVEAFAAAAEGSILCCTSSESITYPKGGPAAEWRMWGRLLSTDGISLVIGGQGAAMAPLRGLARIIVDDESNNIWRTLRHPCYNVRSLLSVRAKFCGASLLLGGRMPSARAYMRLDEETRERYKRRRRVFFVDMKLAYSPQISGTADTLAVSDALVRETAASIDSGRWALWVLDRHGYAREIVCEECGVSVSCSKCGAAVRLEAAKSAAHPEDGCSESFVVRCNACGLSALSPEVCPNCRGRLLAAKRPGIEALFAPARAAVYSDVPVISFDEASAEAEKLSAGDSPGLILGTRAVLALCDKLDVGLIGWIDADGEARASRHDARVRAFGLIWESCWRGLSPEGRRIIVQSRRAGRDWQRGLSEGWSTFWRSELHERKLFGMPPFLTLVSVEGSGRDIGAMGKRLDDGMFEYWIGDDEGSGRSIMWIRTKQLSALRALLEPFFDIRRVRYGIPKVTVWHD